MSRAIERIDDVRGLERLVRLAATAESLDAFRRAVEEEGPSRE